MNNRLALHPSALSSAAGKLIVHAQAELSGHCLLLDYKIESPHGAPKLVWPVAENSPSALTDKLRRDELWKSTCLEAFVLFAGGNYIELNFSPSGEWNAYSFDSYREGMKQEARLSAASDFKSVKSGDPLSANYLLSVKIDLAQAVKSPQHFRLGLTSVIETDSGERSYWCLKHTGEKPDFHDSRGHILEMRI